MGIAQDRSASGNGPRPCLVIQIAVAFVGELFCKLWHFHRKARCHEPTSHAQHLLAKTHCFDFDRFCSVAMSGVMAMPVAAVRAAPVQAAPVARGSAAPAPTLKTSSSVAVMGLAATAVTAAAAGRSGRARNGLAQGLHGKQQVKRSLSSAKAAST